MVGELELRRRRELYPRKPFDLAFKPIQAAILNRVFKPRVSAIGAIAIISLGNKYGPPNGIDGIRPNEAEYLRELRISFHVAVVHPHAPADSHVVAGQSAVVDYCYKPEIL